MKSLYTFTLAMMAICYLAIGQSPFRDLSFGQNGVVITDLGPQYDVSEKIVIQSDNKIVLAGKKSLGIDDSQYILIRYNPDGSIDNSFGENGYCVIDAGTNESYNKLCLAIDQNDVIYFAGQMDDLNCIIVAKVNTNGILVDNFGTNGIASLCGTGLISNNILIQSDGKLVVTGYFQDEEQNYFGMTRINDDGTTDNTFGNNGIVQSYFGSSEDLTLSSLCYCSDICSDGKIVLGGSSTDTSSNNSLTVAKYNLDGSLDQSFGINGIKMFTLNSDEFWRIYGLEIDENDKINYVGYKGSSPQYIFVGRLNSNGNIDFTFNSIGYTPIMYNPFANPVLKLQDDGKIIVAMRNSLISPTYNYLIARFNTDGSYDNSFGINGKIFEPEEFEFTIKDFAIQNDGKVVVTGISRIDYNYSFAMFRFLDDKNINGSVYFDENENEVFDEGEVGLPQQIVKVEPGPYYICTNNDGIYFYANNPQQYTVSFIPLPYWEPTTENQYYEINITNENDIFTDINFGAIPKVNITDLSSSLTGTNTRSGFETYMWLSYQNIGTTTQNGIISLDYDPAYTFLETDRTPTSHVDNHIEWEYNSLSSLQNSTILLKLRVPGVEFLSDTLVSICKITPIVGDSVPTNNTDTLTQIIVGSYDPNDKQVSPRGIGEDGFVLHNTELTYTIRFQNTGTDTAFNIVVTDTLCAKLNIETFRFISSSHNCNYQIDGRPDGTAILTFNFSNILLPHEDVNELGSNGFVKFSIRPKFDLPDYTIVKNLANIYFDFNPAIITNEVTNTFVSSLTNIKNHKNQLNIYPNPCSGLLHIDAKTIKNVGIYCIDGKLVHSFGESSVIDISDFQSGIYLIKIETSDQNYTEKIIKR